MALVIRELDTGSSRELQVVAYDEAANRDVGSLRASRSAKKVGGKTVYAIREVYVTPTARRRGVATALYEAAAQEACRRRASLASTMRSPDAFSHDFWAKQERKGRARHVRGPDGGKYVLDCAHRGDLSGLGAVSWSKQAPTTKQRRKMPARCFADPKNKKYPVCPARSKTPTCQGVEAAYKRARQQYKPAVAKRALRMKTQLGCKW